MPRESKPEIEVPRKAWFSTAGEAGERVAGWIVRLSIVGGELESMQPPPIGSDIVVWATLHEGEEELELRGRVQWSKPGHFAVQFGPLGARATNALVRTVRRSVA